MPAAVLIPLVTSGIAAGVQLYGAKKQADAQSEANGLQAQVAREQLAAQTKAQQQALQVQLRQQQIDEQTARAQQQARAPYLALGNSALTQASNLLGVPAPSFQTQQQMAQGAYQAPPMPDLTGSGGLTPSGGPGLQGGGAPGTGGSTLPNLFSATAPSGGLNTSAPVDGVLMESPDGKERKSVPRSEVGYWQSKGAKVVG